MWILIVLKMFLFSLAFALKNFGYISFSMKQDSDRILRTTLIPKNSLTYAPYEYFIKKSDLNHHQVFYSIIGYKL